MAKKTGNIDVGYLTISTNITSWKVDFYVYHLEIPFNKNTVKLPKVFLFR